MIKWIVDDEGDIGFRFGPIVCLKYKSSTIIRFDGWSRDYELAPKYIKGW